MASQFATALLLNLCSQGWLCPPGDGANFVSVECSLPVIARLLGAPPCGQQVVLSCRSSGAGTLGGLGLGSMLASLRGHCGGPGVICWSNL